jgi:cyclophilin family peptidyl-prolyl cis-trans isomerase
VCAAVAALVLPGCGEGKPYEGPALPYTAEPPKARQPDPIVELDTDMGRITLQLFEDDAPNTVGNFVSLVEQKFYDGIKFHRIAKNPPVIQAGDRKGDGSGGPGYCIPDEIKGNPNKHNQYALAMARRGPPNSGGSQFYIVTGPQGAHNLDKGYTIFGKVVSGFEAVDAIGKVPTEGEKPKSDVKILGARVVTRRNHVYEAKTKLPDPSAVKIVAPHDTKGVKVVPGPVPAVPKPEEKKAEEKKAEEKKGEEKKTEEKKADEKK